MVPPLLSTAPPLSVSLTKPEAPLLKFWTTSITGTLVAAQVPVNVTWKPVLLKVPPAEARDGCSAADRQDRRKRRRYSSRAESWFRSTIGTERVAIVVERERVVRAAVVRLLDRMRSSRRSSS